VHTLAGAGEDIVGALQALADELAAPRDAPVRDDVAQPELHGGPFKPEAFGLTLAALLPENAVVAEDAVTSGRALFPLTWGAAPHDWIQITGGAIGTHSAPPALPSPARAQGGVCRPTAPACISQVPWTRRAETDDQRGIREPALCDPGELAAVGAQPGPASKELFDLERPEIRWTKLAEGMGVEAVRVETLEGFADVFTAARARRGPFLIEFSI
jgi:acetolactate synthase-1/2/3 large subunit